MEHMSNPQANYDGEAIANLSNFVKKYHTKIKNLSNLLDQNKSLSFPNISATNALNAKGGKGGHGGTHLPWRNGNNYISGQKNIIRGKLCMGNTCITENDLKGMIGAKNFYYGAKSRGGAPIKITYSPGNWWGNRNCGPGGCRALYGHGSNARFTHGSNKATDLRLYLNSKPFPR